MWHPRKRWLQLMAGVLLAATGAACGARHPPDAQLIARFHRERASFETLKDMFLAEKTLGRIAPTFTRPVDFFSAHALPPETTVSVQRLAEYRILFQRLGLESGIEGYDAKEEIFFHASSSGLSISGSSKGYAYLAHAPPLVVPDLDRYWSSDGQSFTAFRHIDGRWYLYFDFED
jgi:hypothetical protein